MSVVSESLHPLTRELSYGERCIPGGFTCSRCKRRVAASESVASVVSIVEDGVAIELDGEFCCENCAHDEAMEADLDSGRMPRQLTDDHEISGAQDGIGNVFSDADPGL